MSPAEFQYAYKQSAKKTVPLFCVENSLFNSSLALPLPPPRASDGGRQLAAKIRCHRTLCSDEPDSRHEVRPDIEADRPPLQSRSFVDVASATMSADGVPTKPKSVRRCAIRTANFTGAVRQTTGFILKQISGPHPASRMAGGSAQTECFPTPISRPLSVPIPTVFRHQFWGRFLFDGGPFCGTKNKPVF